MIGNYTRSISQFFLFWKASLTGRWIFKSGLFILLCCKSSVLFAQQKSLDEFIQSAIKFSPVYIDNTNQLQSLALDSLLIRAGLKPQVNFISNDMYAPVINGFGYDNAITNGANVNALLGVNYTLVGRKNLMNQYGFINIQKNILTLKLKLSERDLKQSVEQQFITVYGEQESIRNEEEVLALFKKEEAILKQLTQSAVYNQTDYLNFLVTLNQRKLSYSQQLLQARNDFYVLNYLCGIADTTYYSLSPPTISIAKNYSVTQSLLFQQFVFDSLRIKNSFDKIQYLYKPRLSVMGDAGYNSSLAVHPEKNFGASLGLNLSVPIYNGRQRNFQEQKIFFEQNSNKSYRNYFIAQYNIKQTQLIEQIAGIEKILADGQQQLLLSKTLIDAYEKMLPSGDLKIADYLFSVSNYLSSQNTISQLKINRIQLISQFNYFIQ